MPYTLSTIQLPSGTRCMQIDWSGVASGEDAATILKEIVPGGRYHGFPILALCHELESMSPEARGLFGRFSDQITMAIVITNAILRVATNFVMRMNKNPRQRMFRTQEEAVRWLDERSREGKPKAT